MVDSAAFSSDVFAWTSETAADAAASFALVSASNTLVFVAATSWAIASALSADVFAALAFSVAFSAYVAAVVAAPDAIDCDVAACAALAAAAFALSAAAASGRLLIASAIFCPTSSVIKNFDACAIVSPFLCGGYGLLYLAALNR